MRYSLDSTDSSTDSLLTDHVSSDDKKAQNLGFTEIVTTQVTTQRIYHQDKNASPTITKNPEPVSRKESTVTKLSNI